MDEKPAPPDESDLIMAANSMLLGATFTLFLDFMTGPVATSMALFVAAIVNLVYQVTWRRTPRHDLR